MSEATKQTVPVRRPKIRKAKGTEVVKQGSVLLPPKGYGVLTSKWRPRWLVLQKGVLTFYKDQTLKEVSQQIQIGDVQSCGRTSEKKQEFALSMDLVSQKAVVQQVVAFESNQEMDDWISTIEGNAPRMLASIPTGFKHHQHLGVTGEMEGMPDQWKSLLQNSDITQEEYEKNKDAVQQAVEYYADKNEKTSEPAAPPAAQPETQPETQPEEPTGEPTGDETQPQTGAAEAPEEEAPPEKSADEIEADKIIDECTTQEDVWSKYTKTLEVGKSGCGVVYEATEIASKAAVYVKQISIDEQGNKLELLREMQKLLKNSHKNITNLLEAYQDSSVLSIVFENPKKEQLDNIDSSVEMQDHEIAAASRGALDGLIFLHSLDIVHKNLRAGNVVFDDTYAIKLRDFGSCCRVTPDSVQHTLVPYWVAPEIVKKEAYDGRSDVWSLGILAVEMLDGGPPFKDEDPIKVLYKITSEEPPQPEVDAGEAVMAFITRCLVKDPAGRPKSTDLVDDAIFDDMATPEEVQVLVDGEDEETQ